MTACLCTYSIVMCLHLHLLFLAFSSCARFSCSRDRGHQSATRPCFWAAVTLDSKLGALSHGGRSQGKNSRLNITLLARRAAMKTEFLHMRVVNSIMKAIKSGKIAESEG